MSSNQQKQSFRLGDYLLHNRIITEDQLKYALKVHAASHEPLGMVLVDLGLVDEEVIIDHLINLLPEEFLPDLENGDTVEYSDLESMVDVACVNLFKAGFCRKNKVMPIATDQNNSILKVAMLDPADMNLVEEIGFISGYKVKPFKTGMKDLQRLWVQFLATQTSDADTEEKRLIQQVGLQLLVPRVNEANVPQFVDAILQQAVVFRSSDIHIDPYQESVMIRYRIDGTLQPVCEMPHKTYKQIISRIKIMSSMDISETRSSQEGRIEVEISKQQGRRVDFRVAMIPTYFGERVAFRILDKRGMDLNIMKLGLDNREKELMLRYLGMKQGLILVTGPTGSGKTTTLYSMLNNINDFSRNIMTIEDPIEYLVKGLNQIQTDERHAISYSTILKYLLRHNPDVVLVGEIRDTETAEMAVRAALTGHLIISTVHTNDTSTAISRMIDLGVKPYLLAPALQLVIAQRLVRMLCPNCKKQINIPVRDLLRAGVSPYEVGDHLFYEGEGCAKCAYTGIFGVTGVYEVMPVTRAIREKIMRNASSIQMRSLAMNQGMKPLKRAALTKARQGLISIYECGRVSYNS
jgi:type IV pilus assembly protein PilB